MPKLYTAKIYDSLRIRKAMPDAVQICVQRRPWQYIRNDADVIRLRALGPPIRLHKETQAFLAQIKGIGASSAETVNFQTRYAAKYLSYIILDDNITAELKTIDNYLTELKKDVILECSCLPGHFCHRLLLYYFLIHWFGEVYAGGELKLKEEPK